MINRIDFKNNEKKTNFEIVDLPLFFETRPHEHLERNFRLNFWMILFITEGSGAHSIDFVLHQYKKGDIIFVQKNQVHHFEVNSDVRGYVVHINEPFFYLTEGFKGDIFLEFMDKAFGSPLLSFDLSRDSTDRILIDLIYKEYNQTEERFNIDLIASLFQALILSLRAQLPRAGKNLLSGDYDNFKIYRQLVEENFTTAKRVEDYSLMMNLSKKTINQATRKGADLSAKQYIINRLVLEIKRYLSQGDFLNYEISDLLGFDEAANMTRFFSLHEGMSPSSFRKKIKTNMR